MRLGLRSSFTHLGLASTPASRPARSTHLYSPSPRATNARPATPSQAFAAFAADSNTTLETLLNDPTLLRHLLLYHLVPEPLDPATLAATPVMDTTWQGAQVFVPQPYQVGCTSYAVRCVPSKPVWCCMEK